MGYNYKFKTDSGREEIKVEKLKELNKTVYFANERYEILYGFDDHWMDYVVLLVTSWETDGKTPVDKEYLLDGFIKWDGCMQFNCNDLLHFDEDEDVESFGKMLMFIRQLAAKEIPKWNN